MPTPTHGVLLTAPTADQAQPGDMIGLNEHNSPARRAQDVRTWGRIAASKPVSRPGSMLAPRQYLTIEYPSGECMVILGAGVPVVLERQMTSWGDCTPRYTDGTAVRVGDRIRYHQAPGGLMAPASDADGYVWTYGVAVALGPEYGSRPNELHLEAANGRRYGIYGHVIERADA